MQKISLSEKQKKKIVGVCRSKTQLPSLEVVVYTSNDYATSTSTWKKIIN